MPGTLLGHADAGEVADPYDALYDVIMVRPAADGNTYGTNEVGPLIYGRSEFPFDDETYPKLTAAMERFDKLTQEQIATYPAVKRAILQRHLWSVFDATIPNDYKPVTHVSNRRASQKLIATLIRRIALTDAEIRSLPDTRAATIAHGGYPQQHDPEDPFKPFLPADLYAKDSSWVCLGKGNYVFTDHGNTARWRSVFLQFVRLPEGRKATLEYVTKLNDREVFPIGTQFALIDHAFLISDKGELVLSPLINSIQLRAYLNITATDLELRPRSTVCVAEFVMQPRRLIKGQAVMKALGPEHVRYHTLSASSGGKVDPFQSTIPLHKQELTPTLRQCTNCHGRSRAGVRSLGDFMFGDRYAGRLTFEAGDPVTIAQAVAAEKRENKTWKALRQHWPAEPSGPRQN